MGRARALLLGVLLALSACAALTLATVVVLQVAKVRVVEHRKQVWQDSVALQVFGLERQFLLFRGELRAALQQPVPDAAEAITRWELLVSRINLVKTSNSLEGLVERPEHQVLLPRLDELVTVGDRLLLGGTPTRASFEEMLTRVDELLPDVRSYTLAAAEVTSRVIKEQFDTVLQQASLNGILSALQLLFIGLAGFAVWYRHREDTATQARQRALTEQLREATLAAEAGARAKGQFLANMSHELRTPFQGLLGMMQLLGKTELSVTQRDLVRTASESANHLLTVLNEILDVSAIEAGNIVLHETAFDLQQACAEVAGLMRVQAQARRIDLHLDLRVEDVRWLHGDVTRIKQILFNLLNNAIKFTERGHVRLNVTTQSRAGRRVELTCRVIDTGIGMDAQVLQRLFRRFEPGDSGLSRRFSGTGLGLEISRTLARLMGGDLTARSEVGVGSEFLLVLPLDRAEAPQPMLPSPPAVADSAPKRILVADDHPINRRYLQISLEGLGHQVVLCENGQEAVAQVRGQHFDAVLMDIHMPGMDGIEATRIIRALPAPAGQVPVYAVTADVMEDIQVRCAEVGVSGFLTKPLDVDCLTQVFGQAQPTAAAAPAREATTEEVSPRLQELARRLPPRQLDDLLDMFFDDDAGAIALLREEVLGGGPQAVIEAAHKFRGSARMLGLTELAESAAGVEAWARGGADDGRRRQELEAFDAALERARLSVQAFREARGKAEGRSGDGLQAPDRTVADIRAA